MIDLTNDNQSSLFTDENHSGLKQVPGTDAESPIIFTTSYTSQDRIIVTAVAHFSLHVLEVLKRVPV